MLRAERLRHVGSARPTRKRKGRTRRDLMVALGLPKHLRPQSHSLGSYYPLTLEKCMIYGGPHQASWCEERHGRYYKCSRPGQMAVECYKGASPTLSTTSVPSAPRQSMGAPLAAPSTSCQPTRGRVFATQVAGEESATDDVVAGVVHRGLANCGVLVCGGVFETLRKFW